MAGDADVGLMTVRVAEPLAGRFRAVDVNTGRNVERRRALLARGQRIELVGPVARPVHVEVGRRHFQERVRAHHRRVVRVDQVLRRLLVQRADRVRLRYAGVAMRLELLVVGPEHRQLVVLADLVLAARRVVAEIRQERIRQTAVRIHDRVPRRRINRAVVAERSEPPEPILDERTAGIGVEVLQTVQRRIGDALRT